MSILVLEQSARAVVAGGRVLRFIVTWSAPLALGLLLGAAA